LIQYTNQRIGRCPRCHNHWNKGSRRYVGFLDNQKLAGHFGKAEIVADIGFLYFAEGYGYDEVFYH